MQSLGIYCCCTPSPPSTPRYGTSQRQFFESLNPLQGFKDTDDLETYLYEQSVKIEPKDGSAAAVKPKRPPEALKSPGIKAAKAATPSTFQRSRSHNSNHHNHAGTLSKAPKSPPTASSGSSGRQSNVTSPSVPSSQPTPNTAKTFTSALSPSPVSEDPHFAIVDINPGHQPRWVSDAGRINQAFTSEYASPAPLSPRSPPAAPQLPYRRKPPAPLSSGETRFAFPPNSVYKPPAPLPPQMSEPPAGVDAFPLVNPPRRRLADPLPTSDSVASLPSAPLLGGIATATKPPPLFPKAKRKTGTATEGHDSTSPDAVNQPSTSFASGRGTTQDAQRHTRDSPSVPPRQNGARHLPPPIPSDALHDEVTSHVRGSASLPPRSPTVSLLVPLPPQNSLTSSAPPTAVPSPKTSPPPLPPRHQRPSLSPELQSTGPSLAPPRPPKPGQRNTPVHLPPEEPSEPAAAPPLPPKPYKKRSPIL